MGQNRYWVYDPKSGQAIGPFSIKRLKSIKGFSLEAMVAPDGTQDSGAWKPAGAYKELRRLYPKPPPFPGQDQPEWVPRPARQRSPQWLLPAALALATTCALVAYDFVSRKEAAALQLARAFVVGETTLDQRLSQQRGSWKVSMALPPDVWRVVYHAQDDAVWYVSLGRRQLQPRTLSALTFTVDALYDQYSTRVDAAVSGADLGPIKELERYKCGEKDCLQASAGLYARTAEFDSLPWFAPKEPETESP